MFRSRDTLKHILYIEDDEGLARLLQKRLSRLGYQVEIATSGEEGLERYKSGRFDAVLVDYYLPGMLGMDVIRAASPHALSAPFILLTAAGDEKIAVEAFYHGAADYLVKDSGQVYLDLLPAVMSAAHARVQLARENKEQQAKLKDYAEQLRLSEERLHLAMEGSETGVWDLNLESGALYWSENMRRAYRLNENQSPDLAYWLARIHPDDRGMVDAAIQAHIAGETPQFHALYREKPEAALQQQEWNWALVRGVAVRNDEDKAARMLGTHTDFTPYKRLEQELEIAKNRAEAASRTKSEFLAMMSHEIRTPMNAVMGLSNILAQSELSGRQREIVATLQSSADALLALINDLLDISRIEANQVILERIPVDFSSLIREVAGTLEMQAAAKGIRIALDMGGLEHQEFLGDRTRIRQILLNLCSNAVKFTDAGQVTVSLRARPENGMHALLISVADTGIGIPREKLGLIFEKFVQADQSITRRFGGTGLGLAISRSLAELMGGNIAVESHVGAGSTFTLNLKLEACAPAPQAPAFEQAPAFSPAVPSGAVLLVEDYPANVVVAGLLLESLGYAYEVAASGTEALALLQSPGKRFAVILMDVQMHGMDGFEATRQVRKLEQQGRLLKHYIIGVTAHAMAGDREHCLKAGMNEYISKPIHADELAAKLAEGMRHAGEAMPAA